MSSSNGSPKPEAITRFIPSTNSKDTPNVSIFQDIGYRGEQQDRYIVARLHTGLLLAVMDGHSGHTTCSLIAKHLVLFFSDELERAVKGSVDMDINALNEHRIKQVLRRTVNSLITLTKNEGNGSTLTIAFIEQGYRRPDYLPSIRITTAQIGDSLGAIHSVQEDLLVTLPRHSASAHEEDIHKIKQCFREKYGTECKVSQGYLHSAENPHSGLAVTRALGDCHFILIREPEVDCYVSPSNQLVLFLASDGVLMPEKTAEETALEIVSKMRAGQSAAEIGASFKKLDDNTTLLCVTI